MTSDDTLAIMASVLCSLVAIYTVFTVIRKCTCMRSETPPPPGAVIVAELAQYIVRDIIAQDDDSSRALCPICMERDSTICFIACRHSLCDECAAKIDHHQCPFCRAELAVLV